MKMRNKAADKKILISVDRFSASHPEYSPIGSKGLQAEAAGKSAAGNAAGRYPEKPSVEPRMNSERISKTGICAGSFLDFLTG